MITSISKRGAAEIASHEGLVLEAYLDSKNVWTWGVGVTDASGHKIARYKDTPSTVERAIEVFEWLLNMRYVPDVLDAFEGQVLTEAQLAAATSFHYNTGAIGRASWVKLWKAGALDRAVDSFGQWCNPPEIKARRDRERRLFFGGQWGDGFANIYPVKKPAYKPDFAKARRVDVMALLP